MSGHHDHDLDLVAALAGGWIDDGRERSAAEGLVESCPACRDEYELHTDVAAWLASAGTATLSDEERSALRRSVHAQVQGSDVQEGAQVVAMPQRRRDPTVRWLRLGSVAAALVVVVGVVGALGQGDDAGSDAAIDTFAAEAADAGGPATAADGAAGGADAAGGAAEEAATALQADEDAAASPEITSSASDRVEAFAPPTAPVLTDPAANSLSSLAERVDTFVREVAALEPRPVLTAEDFSAREAPTPECFTTEVEPAHGVLLTTMDGRPVQVFAVPGPDGEVTATARLPDAGCEEVELP